MKDFDVIIIGSGPAGMACSHELALAGARVALLDEQEKPGGQIYRNVTSATLQQKEILKEDYTAGEQLAHTMLAANIEYISGAQVWQATRRGDVYFSKSGQSKKLSCKVLVLATGATERPVPFKGWGLPGVMSCGGASNLFKDAALVPQVPTVLGGNGPFFWLVAEHMLAAKANLKAIFETKHGGSFLKALPYLPQALLRLPYLLKGLKMISHVKSAAKKAGVPVYRGVTELSAEGTHQLEKTKARKGKKELSFDTGLLLVHEGIIANTALSRQLGCAHEFDQMQRYWFPTVDDSGQSTVDNVFIIGDGSFVHGALAAQYKGRLAAIKISERLAPGNKTVFEERGSKYKKQLKKELGPRKFIDAMYRPADDLYAMSDDTMACRCESVTAGEIRELVHQGLTDTNEIKAIIRCGMGPCQARMCGPAVSELVAQSSGLSPELIRPLRPRPPLKPLSPAELALVEGAPE